MYSSCSPYLFLVSDRSLLQVYNPGFTYTFPGPAIASFVAAGSSGNNASANSTASASSAAPSATGSSGGCYDMHSNYAREAYRPRRLSRVMRNIN